MVTSVNLNPSIDKTVHIASFQYGGLNRVLSAREDLAGKAINVAIVLSMLGIEAECAGFMYRDNGRAFEEKLLAHGVKSEFVRVDGAVRTNIKLHDGATGQITEINEPGAPVDNEAVGALMHLMKARAEVSEYMVLTGSVPPGCPADIYRTIIGMQRGRCVLDASGGALREGIKAKPFLIKPNIHELESLIGKTLLSPEAARAAACEIIDAGVQVVAVSMGGKGALIVDRDEAFFAEAMDVCVRSTVGAGDAMVAGLVAGFSMGKPLGEAFKMGAASAAASVMTEGTKGIDASAYRALFQRIQIKRMG